MIDNSALSLDFNTTYNIICIMMMILNENLGHIIIIFIL